MIHYVSSRLNKFISSRLELILTSTMAVGGIAAMAALGQILTETIMKTKEFSLIPQEINNYVALLGFGTMAAGAVATGYFGRGRT